VCVCVCVWHIVDSQIVNCHTVHVVFQYQAIVF